jgi:hypothetical protein
MWVVIMFRFLNWWGVMLILMWVGSSKKLNRDNLNNLHSSSEHHNTGQCTSHLTIVSMVLGNKCMILTAYGQPL